MKDKKGFLSDKDILAIHLIRPTYCRLGKRYIGKLGLLLFIFISCFSLFSYSKSIAPYEYIYIVYAQGDDIQTKKYLKTINRIKEIEPHVRVHLVNQRAPASALQRQLFADGVQCIIGLGESAFKSLNNMSHKHKFDIVYGFVNDNPKRLSSYFGVSTVPSPEAMFTQLTAIDKSRKKVHVVYLKGRDDELIEDAQKAAQLQGITLIALPSESVSDMAMKFQAVMKTIDVERDALWMLSSAHMDSAITNGILVQAWERKMFVFSSDYRDVSRGVLFSLKPNYIALGDRLTQQLNSLRFKPKQQPFISATQNVEVVVNASTADYLKVIFSPEQLKNYLFISSATDYVE